MRGIIIEQSKRNIIMSDSNSMAENIFSNMVGKKVVVRSINAGVFFGTLDAVTADGCSCELSGVRKLWYWEGAAAVEELAENGTSLPEKCKFTVKVGSMAIVGICQIIPATDRAAESIEGVGEWKA